MSRPGDRPPPLFWRWLLEHLLPRDARGEAILGDLEEEYRARLAARSETSARVWYRRQALRVLMGYRLPHVLSRPPRAPGLHVTDPRPASSWSLFEDVRYGARRLAASPSFSLVALMTIGVAVGASTAIFSVLDAVLLRPLPYPDSDRLVQIWETNPTRVLERGLSYSDLGVNVLNYEFYAENARSFEGLAWKTTYADNGSATLSGGDGTRTESVGAMGVSVNFFSLLGADPVLGRTFLPEERAPPGNMRWTEVVVLSHDIWVRRFGADPGIVGQTIRVEGGASTVVGVLPEGFTSPSLSLRGAVQSIDVDLYFPMFYPAYSQPRAFRQLSVVGRLRPGVAPEAAQEEMAALAARLEDEYPDAMSGWTAVVTPLRDLLVRDFGTGLGTLAGMVGFLLVIACANVANLLLARGSARTEELAVRSAIGGDRRRLAQLLLAEGLVLAVAGTAVGTLLAAWGTQTLVSLVPENVPRAANAGLDARVLVFSSALAGLVTLLVGLIPALRFSAPGLGDSLRRRPGQPTGRGSRLTRSLVAAQVALTLVLLCGGALLGKRFLQLRTADRGYDTENVLRVSTAIGAHHALRVLAPDDLEGRRARWNAVRRTQDAVRRVPGITAVAYGAMNLEDIGVWPIQFTDDRPPLRTVNSTLQHVSPEYFDLLKIPLLRGEGLTPWDDATRGERYWWASGDCDADADPWCAVVVSETFANAAWPGEDPIGKHVGVYGCCWRVAGVVGDVNARGIDAPALNVDFDTRLRVYVPYAEVNSGMLLRTEGDPTSYIDEVRAALTSVDPQRVVTVRPLEEDIEESLARPRFYSLVVELFAAIALVLALVGLYGIVAYAVSRRTHEIGVRIALGALRTEIGSMVIKDAMRPVAVGLLLGGLIVAGTVRLLESLLYGMSALDPWVIVIVTLGLTGVCAVASLLPARQASKVDPVTALAHE